MIFYKNENILKKNNLHFKKNAKIINQNRIFFNKKNKEVERVKIDPLKGEVNQWSENPNESVQSVLNYLNYLNVNKLKFIISTHSHSDHIGGIPAIAYKYVNHETKYYYKKYRKTIEDIKNIDWANKKYFIAAFNSKKMLK